MIYFLSASGLPISVQAKLSARSRSSFYYRPKKPKKDEELLASIKQVQDEHPYYGYRRIALVLKVNHKRIHRVMKKAHLASRSKKRRHGKNQYSSQKIPLPNHMKDVKIQSPNYAWAGDFTHIQYQRRSHYIATVIDLYTRQIVGWHIATNHSVYLVLEALKMAFGKRSKLPLIFHSDQGSEYLSQAFIDKLKENGITPSNSQKGKPWQNGIQESFYHRFKQEFGDPNRFPTLDKLVEALGRHFHLYNAKRIHSTLKKTPDAFYAESIQA